MLFSTKKLCKATKKGYQGKPFGERCGWVFLYYLYIDYFSYLYMVHAWEPHWYAFLVCAVADDSPTSNETGLAAEGVCSIGILMCVLFVNVFATVEELWEGFETAKGLP